VPDNRIKTLQARLGLSPADLARYLGVARPTADKWLAGQRRPPMVAMRLLDILALLEITLPDVHNSLINRKE